MWLHGIEPIGRFQLCCSILLRSIPRLLYLEIYLSPPNYSALKGLDCASIHVASAKPQSFYDTVVTTAGCSFSPETLSCLRGLTYEQYLNAENSLQILFSYTGVATSYTPRFDLAVTSFPQVSLSRLVSRRLSVSHLSLAIGRMK